MRKGTANQAFPRGLQRSLKKKKIQPLSLLWKILYQDLAWVLTRKKGGALQETPKNSCLLCLTNYQALGGKWGDSFCGFIMEVFSLDM